MRLRKPPLAAVLALTACSHRNPSPAPTSSSSAQASVASTSASASASATSPAPPDFNAVRVFAGQDLSCAASADGTVRCWGFLPAAPGEKKPGPGPTAEIPELMGAKQIALGSHRCAIGADGAVRCWGIGVRGELGEGAIGERTMGPFVVPGLAGAKAIAVGDSHSCAVLENGDARCWGSDVFGELGNGLMNEGGPKIQAVLDLSDVVDIEAGDSVTCARVKSGAIDCWGSDIDGVLGDGFARAEALPTEVIQTAGVTALAVHGRHACAIVADGTVHCWGSNAHGELGFKTPANDSSSSIPRPVDGLRNAVGLALGDAWSCAWTRDHIAQCWGANDTGQLGDGTTTDRSSPAQVKGLVGVEEIVAGDLHACARLTSGSVRCWGANAKGQLGDGTTDNKSEPVEVRWR